MAVENITLNLIPTGEIPSIHVAQFDVDRSFTVTLKEGEDDFTPTGYTIELQVRKVDNTIVTISTSQSSGNVVTFNTTEQMTACSGTNLAELQLTKDSQTFATLHFYLVVQRDVLAGGVTSESDIYNLTKQIAAIVPEVIGDDYYNKEEVNELIADIPTFDPTNYYNKSETNILLNDKADKTVVDAIKLLPTVKSVSGSVVTFDTDLIDNLIECICNIMYRQESGTPTPADPLPITVYNSLNLLHSDDDTSSPTVINIPFGQTVGKGMINVTSGLLTITHSVIDLSQISTGGTAGSGYVWYMALNNPKTVPNSEIAPIISEKYNSIRFNGVSSTSNTIAIRDNGVVYVNTGSNTTPPSGIAVYELSTPINVQLTPTEITQLLNENNIWCDTNGDTTVKYTLTIGKAIS